MIKAVIAHTGPNKNGSKYYPLVIQSIADQILEHRCIPIYSCQSTTQTVQTMIGSITRPEIQVKEGRTELVCSVLFMMGAKEAEMMEKNGTFLIAPAMSGTGNLAPGGVVEDFTLDHVFMSLTTDHAMPFCRTWLEPALESTTCIDATSEDQLKNQFIALWHRGRGNFYNTPGPKMMYEVGKSEVGI